MPKKCESCRHYLPVPGTNEFHKAQCTSWEVLSLEAHIFGGPMPLIEDAREICDKEGDGIFVYFEPKVPTAGVAFAKAA